MDNKSFGQALTERRAEMHAESLTAYEEMLINKFRSLSFRGKDKTVDYIDDLLDSDLYLKKE